MLTELSSLDEDNGGHDVTSTANIGSSPPNAQKIWDAGSMLSTPYDSKSSSTHIESPGPPPTHDTDPTPAPTHSMPEIISQTSSLTLDHHNAQPSTDTSPPSQVLSLEDILSGRETIIKEEPIPVVNVTPVSPASPQPISPSTSTDVISSPPQPAIKEDDIIHVPDDTPPSSEEEKAVEILRNTVDQVQQQTAEGQYEQCFRTLSQFYTKHLNIIDLALDYPTIEVYVEMLESVETRLKERIVVGMSKAVQEKKLRDIER